MSEAIAVEDYGGAGFARVASVTVASGETVSQDQPILEIENHKVTQELAAPQAGRLLHNLKTGDLVRLNTPIALIVGPNESVDEDSVMAELNAGRIDEASEAADGHPLTVLKATELATLGSGAADSMLSTLGADVGPIVRGAETPDFYRAKIVDLIAFEASRLLAGPFSRLNAYFQDGRVFERTEVNAGIAFDEGGRLIVVGVQGADRTSLPDLQNGIIDGLMRYMGKELAPQQVSQATFTISDLSAAKLTFSFPLLPRGQCIIIAVTRSEAGGYALFVSFDHRVTEGLLVSSFLTELVGRLRSFSLPIAAPAQAFSCSFCDKPLGVEVGEFGGKGLARIVDAQGKDALCCSACFGGW